MIAETVETLIDMNEELIEEPHVVSHAVKVFATTKLDVIDCILVGYSKIKGYSVFSFDKALKKLLK